MNITLRPYNNDDYVSLYRALSPDLTYALGSVQPRTLAECRRAVWMYMRGHGQIGFFYAIQLGALYVGHIELARFEPPLSDVPSTTCNVAYFVNPRYRARGVATAAVGTVLDIFERERYADAINTIVKIQNIPSLKVLTRNGFQITKQLKDYPFGGIPCDCAQLTYVAGSRESIVDDDDEYEDYEDYEEEFRY